MGTNYYQTDVNYPLNLKSALETYLQYIVSRLYPGANVKDRLVLANIGSGGSEGATRYNLESFQKTNLKYPFTAYSVGELIQDESRINHFAKSGNYFDSLLDCNVSVVPCELEVPLISFFSNAFDYNRARTILLFDYASLTRLYYPLRVNGRIITTVINVQMEDPTKGSYTYEFEEALKQGKIFDIVHNVKLQFNEIVLNTERDGRKIPTYPVESLDLGIVDFLTGEFIENENYIIPIVESTNVAEGQIVSVQDLELVFTFSTGFLPDQIPDVVISPEVPYDYVLSSDDKTLTLTPITPFIANETYTVTINPTIVSEKGMIMQNPFELKFSTKV